MLELLSRLWARTHNIIPASSAHSSITGVTHPQPGNGTLQRAPAAKVLMLDIDGVLHPAQSGTLIYLPLLEEWLHKHLDVDVVISSNWKDTHTLLELQSLFHTELRERVIGTTSDVDDYREEQILTVVRRYNISRWAAVDDRADGFPTTAARHLAKTDTFDGITTETFERIESILYS